MRILGALGDALFRPSTLQNWPRDRKLTQSCWCLHWLPSSYSSDQYSLFEKISLAIVAMNEELPAFKNGKHNSESGSTFGRDITPLETDLVRLGPAKARSGYGLVQARLGLGTAVPGQLGPGTARSGYNRARSELYPDSSVQLYPDRAVPGQLSAAVPSWLVFIVCAWSVINFITFCFISLAWLLFSWQHSRPLTVSFIIS